MIRHSEERQNRYHRLLDGDEHDPLAGVSNLFDVAMVFAVALLIALFARVPASELLRQSATATQSQAGNNQRDAIPRVGDRLERFQVDDREAGGRGERLGVAYRLSSGEVIYVPESDNPKP